MQIGVIGSGHIGSSLVRRLTALGHHVAVANSRDPETLADLAAETGARAVWAADAATDADLVVVTVPMKAVPGLPAGLVGGRRDGAPVVDTNNYYPRERDGLIAAIEDGQTESAWVAERLGAPVVKAFNGIFWKHLLEKGAPAGTEGRIALPVAGDAPQKDVVLALVEELGFSAVDAGTIDESWRQQPGTPAYGARTDPAGLRELLAQASPERPEAFRA